MLIVAAKKKEMLMKQFSTAKGKIISGCVIHAYYNYMIIISRNVYFYSKLTVAFLLHVCFSRNRYIYSVMFVGNISTLMVTLVFTLDESEKCRLRTSCCVDPDYRRHVHADSLAQCSLP